MDAVDQQILTALRKDGRATYDAIAAEVKLSAPAIKRRVDRLKQTGAIQGFTVIVDHHVLGAHTEAAAQFGRAIRVAGDASTGDRAGLLQRCAIELYLINRVVQAIDLQQQAVELTRDDDDQADHGVALRWLSRMLWFGGHGEAAARR